MYCRATEPSWICSEIHVTNTIYTTSLPEDMDVAFHALLKLHELAVLLEMCRTTLTSPGITTDQLQWPDFMARFHASCLHRGFSIPQGGEGPCAIWFGTGCASGGRPNAIQYFSRCQ